MGPSLSPLRWWSRRCRYDWGMPIENQPRKVPRCNLEFESFQQIMKAGLNITSAARFAAIWATFWTIWWPIFFVYFDQQTHACACVRMVENDKKHSKMMKKVLFLLFAREALVRRMKKNEEKSHNFWMFFIVFNHANACASMLLWSKYKTVKQQ